MTQKLEINILSLVGENCITREAGSKIYDIILPALSSNMPIKLDFSDVRIFASPFFNFAIGRLLKDFDSGFLNKNLEVVNISPVGMDVLKLVIENSSQYYKDEAFKKAVNEVIEEQGDE